LLTAGTLALSGGGSIGSSSNLILASAATWDVTAVNGGTGTLNASQTLRGEGVVRGNLLVLGTVSPGSSLGTLSFSNGLTLRGDVVMETSKQGAVFHNDRLVGGSLSQGGTLTVLHSGDPLAAGDSFDLLDGTLSGAFTNFALPALPSGMRWNSEGVAVSGVLAVVAVDTTPTNLTSVVNGGNLDLSWPASHQGWRLEYQTTGLQTGLGTNWTTWPGSINVHAVSVPLTTTNPAVFFRLAYP
jgi:hypothetical protein